jgi:putative flavoprotein involved in K+ transport
VVTASPGIYVLGGNLLRTRRSSYIAGAAADTQFIADHLERHLGRAPQRAGVASTTARVGWS